VAWQREHGRHDLPWQGTRDAYRIWLSEIMLQQTQVSTALPYYARFVAAFPDVERLAAAPLERVLAHWSGLGYYRRAHLLHAAARGVVERFAGRMPVDAATLATLPGIGRSTAAAIAAFASGERGAILDGNVKRVLARHAGIDGYPGAPAVASRLWRVAEMRLPHADIEAYTQGLMDLGATICTRVRPACMRCPVARDCVARLDDRIGELPAARPRKLLPERAIGVLVIVRGDAVLFERRPETGVWAGLWSLPELATTDSAAREVSARFSGLRDGVSPRDVGALAPVRHVFTHFALTLHPHRVDVDTAPVLEESGRYRWIARDELESAALPAPIRRIVEAARFQLALA
jgi:A/G-specific adenine glycosylase